MDTTRSEKQWRGGAGVGPIMVRWPFAKLRARPDNLELTARGKHYTVTREHVTGIERASFFPAFGMGFKILHDVHNYPALKFFPVFARSRRIIEYLKRLGYKVT